MSDSTVKNQGSGGPAFDAALVNGAKTSSSASVTGDGALVLDASASQYLQIPAFTIGSAGISFACWFLSKDGKDAHFLDFGNDVNVDVENIVADVKSGKLELQMVVDNWNGYYDWLTNAAVVSNVWYHFVWTISPSGLWTVYMNGQLYGSSQQQYPAVTSRSLNYLGLSGWGGCWSGAMDDFRYYTRVLTQAQVLRLYSRGTYRLAVSEGFTWIHC